MSTGVHPFRHLRLSPASTASAIVTLALTLAAGTTIFAIVDAVLLTPPPFVNPETLVTLGEAPVNATAPGAPRMISYPTFEAWRARASALAAVAAYDPANVTMTGLGPAERVSVTDVDSEFLRLLGVAPVRGRPFTPDDVGQPLVIVSGSFWHGRLGGDPNVIGRSITLGGRRHTIVGVLPADFRFPLNPCEIWRPLPLTAAQAARTTYRMRAIARLAPAVTPAALEQALGDTSLRSDPPSRAIVTPFATAIARGSERALGLLAAAGALAILIAFANLAGLLIVRSIDRTRELAVRAALGARRLTIAGQLILEAEALVALGAAAGILLATALTPAAGRLVNEQFGAIANRAIAIDWRVIAATVAVSICCAAVCAVGPAVLAARRAGAEVLRRGATRPPHEVTLRRWLIVGEVALAFVLIVSMAVVGRSLADVLDVDPGFRADGVLTMRVSLPAARYRGDPEEAAFYGRLQNALTRRLGSGTSSVVDEIPLTGDGGRTLVGRDRAHLDAEAVARTVATSYFDVMGIPIVAGRPLDARDGAAVTPRVVVGTRLAARLFGDAPAIGRQIWLAGPSQMVEVVGVAGDVKHRALDEPAIDSVYSSAWQSPSRSSHIVVRADRPPADVVAIVREEVARLDPELPVYAVRSMHEVIAASAGVPARRLVTWTFSTFALLALILSAVGLFGVVAHDVASRRFELAVRLALGARPVRLGASMLGQGATMVGLGVAAGTVLSMLSGPILSGLAPAAARFDVVAAVTSAGLLFVVGICAVAPAARRAARTSPLLALRGD